MGLLRTDRPAEKKSYISIRKKSILETYEDHPELHTTIKFHVFKISSIET